MDWLRIAAFGLLILYHIGMFFVPWDWHVKTAHPLNWVRVPLLATNSWRIPLLFVVSGYASAALLGKSGRVGRFLADRSARLLVPLVAGMALFVAPQPWAELVFKHGYGADLLEFQRPDIIFTDYNMPDLKGVELVRWVRARPEFDDVPVFVVSSEETLETRSRMAAAGANGWVAKPVCAATLLSVIEAVAAGLRRPSQHTGFEPALAAAC